MTPDQIAALAREKGVDAVLFTDDAIVRVSYGPFPLRNLLKVSFGQVSVFKRGLRRYLDEMQFLNHKYPDLLLIPALEVAPFYYWERSPLTGHGILRDWNKHLLVMGLDETGFLSLPLIGSRPVPLKPFEAKDCLRVWGLLAVVVAVFCFRKHSFDYRDESGRNLAPPSPFFHRVGWVLLVIGGISLAENYPYHRPAFSIYEKEKVIPYQNLIDDVQRKGGLVFWAHPEGKTISRTLGPVTFLTDPYPEALQETADYTGYAIFYEGFKTIGPVGGIWDQLLRDYCEGKRKRPLWAIGELDYTREGLAGTWIDTVKTIIFAKEKSEAALLEAMKEGRMVALRHPPEGEIQFGHFWIEDSASGRRADIGETLSASGPCRTSIYLSSRGEVPEVVVRLIRDGNVIQTWQRTLPMEEIFEDAQVENPLSFYRIEVQSIDGRNKLVTNPIFVSKGGSP